MCCDVVMCIMQVCLRVHLLFSLEVQLQYQNELCFPLGLTLCSPIDDVLKLMQSLDASSLSALIWLGVGPGALATCMQVFGQKRLPPDQAQVRDEGGIFHGSYFVIDRNCYPRSGCVIRLQVVYNTVPVWSAIMAAWMLGEGMGLLGWFGSSALILATLILAF